MFAWIIRLLTLRIMIDHIDLGKDVYCGCFRCEQESSCQFEAYLDFSLVLNVKLNLSKKFVCKYMSLQVSQDAP